jgi:hypothetical protein
MTDLVSEAARPVEVARYLGEHGFTRHADERSWWVRDNIRVVTRIDHKISIYVYDRRTGDGWIAHLESVPLRVLATLLESEPRPVPAARVVVPHVTQDGRAIQCANASCPGSAADGLPPAQHTCPFGAGVRA